jgi:hypothetical protein
LMTVLSMGLPVSLLWGAIAWHADVTMTWQLKGIA